MGATDFEDELELAEELAALRDAGTHTAECDECLTELETELLDLYSTEEEEEDE